MRYLLICMLITLGLECKSQSAFEKYLSHNTEGELVEFNDDERIITFENQRLKSVRTSDSILLYDFESNTITIINESGLTTKIIYGEYKAEIHFNDTILELDSLEYLRWPGTPITPMSSAFVKGVTNFNRLNEMPVFNVYYNRFYPDSMLIQTGGRAMWFDLDLLMKDYPVNYLLDTSENKYFCILFGKNCHPKHIVVYDYAIGEGIVFSSLKGNGKFNFIYKNIYPPGSREANPMGVYQYSNNGKVKMKIKLKKKHLYNALSVNRTISNIRKYKTANK